MRNEPGIPVQRFIFEFQTMNELFVLKFEYANETNYNNVKEPSTVSIYKIIVKREIV